MFKIFKRKVREIASPCDGEIVSLDKVNDEVFSTLMVGDGLAIKPINGTFTSPIDGVVSKIFSTNHAYSIKSDKDLEVLVHIGLDTVDLNGEGFTRVVEEGDSVKMGDTIIIADLNYLSSQNKDTITPIIITENSSVKNIEKRVKIVKSKDIIMRVS